MEAVERINEVENSRTSTPPPHTMIASAIGCGSSGLYGRRDVRRTTNSARFAAGTAIIVWGGGV